MTDLLNKPNTALVFLDIHLKGTNKDDTLYKVVAYVPNYDGNLLNTSWKKESTTFPFREVWSSVQKNIRTEQRKNAQGKDVPAATPFLGHMRGTSAMRNPLQMLCYMLTNTGEQ